MWVIVPNLYIRPAITIVMNTQLENRDNQQHSPVHSQPEIFERERERERERGVRGRVTLSHGL